MAKREKQTSALWRKLPPRDEMDDLMAVLDPAQLRQFTSEVLDELYDMEHDPKLERLIHAWHRSLRFLAKPGFRERLAEFTAFPGR